MGDPDQNSSAEILVGGPYKDNAYGHTALRVTTPTSDRVYDYGRYGKTWGIKDMSGEGILQVWNDPNAYIAEENGLGRVTTGYSFPITEEKANEITAHYEQLIKGQCPTCEGEPRTKTPEMTSYKLPTDYYPLGPNCVTTTLGAAQIALPDIANNAEKYNQGQGLSFGERALISARGWPDHIFTPQDAQSMLDTEASGTATVHQY
jgi:hypothetical protein